MIPWRVAGVKSIAVFSIGSETISHQPELSLPENCTLPS